MAAKKNYSRLFKAQKAFDEKVKREFLEGKSAVCILKNRKHFKFLFKDNSDEAFFRYISKLTKEVNNPMKKEKGYKLLASAFSDEGIKKLIAEYWYNNDPNNIKLDKIDNYYQIIQTDQNDRIMTGYRVIIKKGRFHFIRLDEVKNPSENKVDEFNEIIHLFKKSFAGVIGSSWGKYLNDKDMNEFKKHLKDEIDTLMMTEIDYIFPEGPGIRVKVLRAAILIEHHIEDLALENKLGGEGKYLDNLLSAESKIIMYLRKYVK